MRISVIIAYHGETKYIMDCFASLAEQTYRDFEVIVVCDGCEEPDVSQFPELTVRFVKQEASGSVAIMRNLGIEKAEGEYLYFLDADDYIDTNMFEQMIQAAVPDGIVYATIRHTWYSRKVHYDNGEELNRQNGTAKKDRFRGDCQNPYEFLIMRANGLQNVTILGMLIARSIVEENELRFDEDFLYFSDAPFLLQVLAAAKTAVFCEESVYIKRKHNDPVNLPALVQVKDEEKKIFEGMRMYSKYKHVVPKDENEAYFDYKFARFLVTRISWFIVKAKPEMRKEVCACLKEALGKMGDGVNERLGRYPRQLVKYGKRGRADKIAKKARFNARKEKVRTVIHSRSRMKRYIYRKVLCKLKMIPDLVVFESFFGKNYSDSPKYIYEYLNQTYPGTYKCVWIHTGKKFDLPYKAKQVRRFSFRYFYYMARSNYFVFNSRQPRYFVKRKGSVFLETWHGTPLKKLVFDMDDVTSASPLYKEEVYKQTRAWDYLVAPNRFSADIFGHAFMYDGNMLETGYPRNDILYRDDKEKLIREIKDELGIPQDKKVILYAPTWRDDEYYGHAKYKFSLMLELDRMRDELEDEYVVILRTHYFIADALDLSEYGGFAFNMSKYDDIARLYLVSDILITDYSSVFFDFANLRRPMLFFTYDLEKYRGVLRGFYMDVEEELPGPMLFDTEQVIDAIHHIGDIQKEYAHKYNKFYDKYCAWEDGHASEKVVNAVFRGE